MFFKDRTLAQSKKGVANSVGRYLDLTPFCSDVATRAEQNQVVQLMCVSQFAVFGLPEHPDWDDVVFVETSLRPVFAAI